MLTFIRQANTQDTEAIRYIAEQTWWPTYSPILSKGQIRFMLDEIYSPEKIDHQITSNEQTYLILEENGKAVAFAAYAPRPEDITIYKLHKLYCLPQTQGKGYGKMLINTVADDVKKNGKNVLDLNVNRNNKALAFYQKMGFKVVYEEDIAIGPYWMNDYVMRLLIS